MIDITAEYLASQGLSPNFPDRFWTKIDKNGPVPEHRTHIGRCWIWTGYTRSDGYGEIEVRNSPRWRLRAHVASWMLNRGPIPNGMYICHHCDRPNCVRPTHLFSGTQAVNIRDMILKNRAAMVGEENGDAVLTNSEVSAIRLLLSQRVSRKDIASFFGISYTNVGAIAIGRSWRHI